MPEIKNYAIRIHGGPTGSGMLIRAQIHLFDDSNKMVGAVDFYDQGAALPKDRNEEIMRMALPAEQLHTVVDMLRNEGPIFLEWQSTLANAYLGTSQEPVGEGEWGYHS